MGMVCAALVQDGDEEAGADVWGAHSPLRSVHSQRRGEESAYGPEQRQRVSTLLFSAIVSVERS